MTSAPAHPSLQMPPAARRVGYAVALAASVGMLVVVNNLVGWGIFPWITAEFNEAVPVLNIAIVVGIVANLVNLWRDTGPARAIGELATVAAGLGALVRLLSIFPFDFSAYSFPWAALTRAVLILGIAGSGFAIVMTAMKAGRPTGDSS